MRMVDSTVDLNLIPLSALREDSRKSLARYLDATKILPSSDGLSRDWRGVLHLSGLRNSDISHLSGSDKTKSQTMELIQILEEESRHITFGHFRKWLGEIDRWDIVDDINELFGMYRRRSFISFD